MTQDDIIRMAREAGLAPIYSACDVPNVSCAYEDWDEEIERFAFLVAAAEREACAKVCQEISKEYGLREGGRLTVLRTDAESGANDCAAVIRARGEK